MDLMSTAQLLGNLGEFLGSVAVVVTLLYLAVQVRNARADADANAFNATSSNSRDVQALFLTHAELWTRANAGEPLNEHESFVFDSLTELRANHAFFAYRRSAALGNGREGIHAVNLAIFFHEHPIAGARWLAREKFRMSLREVAGWAYQPDFVENVERALGSLHAVAPGQPVPADSAHA